MLPVQSKRSSTYFQGMWTSTTPVNWFRICSACNRNGNTRVDLPSNPQVIRKNLGFISSFAYVLGMASPEQFVDDAKLQRQLPGWLYLPFGYRLVGGDIHTSPVLSIAVKTDLLYCAIVRNCRRQYKVSDSIDRSMMIRRKSIRYTRPIQNLNSQAAIYFRRFAFLAYLTKT